MFFKINDIKKITNDSSVRYIPISEKAKEKEIKPEAKKAGSFPRKQNKNISQNSKRILKNGTTAGSGYIK